MSPGRNCERCGQHEDTYKRLMNCEAECERLRADILEAVKDHCDLSEFARPLQPLESLCVQIESERASKESWKQRSEKVETELAEARKDTERLDWLDKHNNEQNPFWYGQRHLRAAIDAARKENQ